MQDMKLSSQVLLPWHKNLWERMTAKVQRNKLPHALLFTGIVGIGKRHFAEYFAAYLLCQERTETAICGKCKNCQLFAAGHHPDFLQVVPEGKVNTIRVDTIRELTVWSTQSAYANGYKVVIIDPPEAMNMAASNSLLKTLEEPVGQTIFILVSASPIQLPATVRSRCQIIKFMNTQKEHSKEWLKSQIDPEIDPVFLLHLAHGAPLKALQIADPVQLQARKDLLIDLVGLFLKERDPLEVAARWQKSDLSWMLQHLYALLMDLVKITLGAAASDLYHYDVAEQLFPVAEHVRQSQLLVMQDKVQEAYQANIERFNVNVQLLLEDIFIEIYQRVTQVNTL